MSPDDSSVYLCMIFNTKILVNQKECYLRIILYIKKMFVRQRIVIKILNFKTKMSISQTSLLFPKKRNILNLI